MGFWGEVIGGPKVWVRDLTLAVAVAMALSFLGPFGSYDRPLEQRIAASVAYGVGGSLVFWPFLRLVLRLGARYGLPEVFTAVVGLVLAALPVMAVVRLLAATFGFAHPLPDPLAHYFAVLAVVLPIGLAALLVYRLIDRRPAPPAETGAPRLLARLPAHLGADVLALEAEDHYVRVHTARGSTLLLMRLADAVAELDGLDGERTHRSWWVARKAVAAARPEGRRMTLTLANGVEAPVTREAVPQLRKAGWI